MHTRTLWIVLISTLWLAACVQPAATPASVQIVEPWARQSQQMAATTSASETTTGAMHAGDAMSATTGVSATMPMTGAMGMGMGGGMGAIYMVIRNPSNQPDRLVKAESDAANVVELHMVVSENGAMAMRQVKAIEAPANGEVILQPGGFHLMLIGLTRNLTVGDTVTVTLTFERAGEITVQAPVRER
jgi:hypothetical protein